MDFDILPQLVIVLSAAGILFILGRNYSKMKAASEQETLFIDNTIQEELAKEKFLYLYKRAVRRINKENYQKKIADFWVWFEKILRKLRIMVMKLDGRMASTLEDIRQKNFENQMERAKKMEMNIRKNMEKENLTKFWRAKREAVRSKDRRKKTIVDDLPAPIEATPNAQLLAAGIEAYKKTEESGLAEKAEPLELVEAITMLEVEEITAPKEESAPEEEIAVETVAQLEVVEEAAAPAETPAGMAPEEEAAETDEKDQIRTKKEEEYIETLMKNPADTKAYWKLGNIYSKRRNYEDALACFHQIVKIDPSYTKAKQKIIELMEKMRKQGK